MLLARKRRIPFRQRCVVMSLMMGWALWNGAAYTGPTLLADWQVQNEARSLPGLRAEQAKCHDVNIVLHFCNMTLKASTAAGEVSRAVSYAFVGLPMGNFHIRVLADPARPELTTTDLGLDHLVNRTVCFALFLLVCVPFAVFSMLGAVGLFRPRSLP